MQGNSKPTRKKRIPFISGSFSELDYIIADSEC
jgi:hypothetical protein